MAVARKPTAAVVVTGMVAAVAVAVVVAADQSYEWLRLFGCGCGFGCGYRSGAVAGFSWAITAVVVVAAVDAVLVAVADLVLAVAVVPWLWQRCGYGGRRVDEVRAAVTTTRNLHRSETAKAPQAWSSHGRPDR